MDQPKRPATSGSFKPGKSGNPAGRKATRRDGWINDASGHGTTRDRRTLTTYGVDIVTDLEAMQLWRSEFLCARMIETEPGEAFRRGYDLKCDDKEKAEIIVTTAEDLHVDDVMLRAAQFERAYGGAAIFPVLEGALGDLHEPLNEEAITRVLALHVIEARELQPVRYYTDITNKKFGLPEIYRFTPISGGRRGTDGQAPQLIHESRLVIFPGTRVSRQTQAGQREGWGDSVLSRPRSVIAGFGMSWGSAETLMATYGEGVLKIDGLAEVLAQSGSDGLLSQRFAAMNLARSTLGVTVIDAKDDYTPRTSSTLSGFDSMLIQQAQLVAAACDMPVTILMGMSPAGLNATGEMDIRSWYDRIAKRQSAHYLPRLERLIRLIMLARTGPMGGKEPDVWCVEFRPLWEPSEKDVADAHLVVAQTDEIYINLGVVSPDDVATSRFGGDTYSANMVVDWKAREEQAKIDEEKVEELDAATVEAMGRPPVQREDGELVEPEA